MGHAFGCLDLNQITKIFARSWHECGQLCEEDGACLFWSFVGFEEVCEGHYQDYCDHADQGVIEAVSGNRGCK